MVKQVSTDDLRHMEGQEGLVLQGCGGDPQEWVDGINDMLTEAPFIPLWARASMALKEAGMQDRIDEMFQRCADSGDYYKALDIISEYVEAELSPKPEPQKSTKKKKARNTHER